PGSTHTINVVPSAAELAASGALDSLFAQIDAGKLQLSGAGGLIPELIKGVLERGLQAEMTSHLGYEKGDPAAGLFENHRNGVSEKTLLTEAGDVPLSVPRDRQGTFTPRLVPKGQRRLGGLDEMIVKPLRGRHDHPRRPASPGHHHRHRTESRDDQQ